MFILLHDDGIQSHVDLFRDRQSAEQKRDDEIAQLDRNQRSLIAIYNERSALGHERYPDAVSVFEVPIGNSETGMEDIHIWAILEKEPSTYRRQLYEPSGSITRRDVHDAFNRLAFVDGYIDILAFVHWVA